MNVVYPKQPNAPLFQGLVKQCLTLGIPIERNNAVSFVEQMENAHVILDAVFGMVIC